MASWFTFDWGDGEPYSDSEASSHGKDDNNLDTDSTGFLASLPDPEDKGKGKEIDTPLSPSPSTTSDAVESPFILLPAELVYAILSYLSPTDLSAVSATCRTLYNHATSDHLWQALVQDNVPGVRVKSPYPHDNFRDLYQAHDPHWFLTKHRIWFSDSNFTGRLVVVRYDQRRGCIEGYQLVAVSTKRSTQTWEADEQVTIHSFEPHVQLHLDKPIIDLPATDPEEYDEAGNEIQTFGGITTIKLSRERRRSKAGNTQPGISSSSSDPSEEAAGSAGSSCRGIEVSAPLPIKPPKTRRRINRFEAEIPMKIGSVESMYSTFMHARPLTAGELAERIDLPFPYGNIWPPPVIPSPHRVQGASLHRFESRLIHPETRPTSRRDISDCAFRVRKWLTMQVPQSSTYNINAGGHAPPEESPLERAMAGVAANRRSMRLHIGEEVSTYATLDPKLYTPTKEKPFRGIWVGDYSGHGCEFLLVTQPDDDPDDPFDLDLIQRGTNESEEDFEKRRYEEMIYRGSLEAIKLSGDPNVPRGEITFRSSDIGNGGYIGTCRDAPFNGVRMVRSEGHIASTGFIQDKFIESQLLMISPNRLAQHWIEWGHISFFERVDIDQFLVPA
ncbi:hypothetical protein QBC35DRAFT_498686 [Podospora australis]|uniref:F-box domain-containing protein n=1 Tax=Podospora australis TaxID=1536484 RepID=A0AAN6WWK9_9PEZI|nr:hypothetical protein QBC35DRAFT_498686 [Podospora australis]